MSIRQHEALRVPQGWNGQDRAFVIQLERVLTDIYRLFGDSEKAMVTDVSYDSQNKKLTITVDGVTSDIVSVETIKNDMGSFTWGQLAGQED